MESRSGAGRSGRPTCSESIVGAATIGVQTTNKQAESLRTSVTRLSPVWPNLPSPDTFIPMVVLTVVLVPALGIWLFGQLLPGQAAWGLLGLDVLEGDWLLRRVSRVSVPPWHAWMQGLMLAPAIGNAILQTTLAPYVFWLGSAAVLYFLVRRWHDETTALLALAVLAFNPVLLRQIQHGMPDLAALFWSLTALWAYVEHLRSQAMVRSTWTFLGGMSAALLFLTEGLSAVWLVAVVGIHLVYDQVQEIRPWTAALAKMWIHPTFRSTLLGGLVVLLVAGPWFLWVQSFSSPVAMVSTSAVAGETWSFDSPARAMPTLLSLALFGVVRALRMRFRRQADRPASLAVIWSLVAYLNFLFIERSAMGLLFVVVPLSILAVRSLQLVVARRLQDRTSIAMVLGTVLVFAFAGMPGMADSTLDLARALWEWLTRGIWPVDPAALGWKLLRVHFAVDLVLAAGLIVYYLYRSSTQNDQGRRLLFGSFAVAVIGLGALQGMSSIVDVRRPNDPWYKLMAVVDRLPRPDWVVFYGVSPPSPELEFVIRQRARGLERHTVRDISELDALLDRVDGLPWVVVTDPARSLPESLPLTQSGTTLTLGRRYRGESAHLYTPIEKQ